MLDAEDQVHKALAIAARDGQHEIIEILLDYGVDIGYEVPGRIDHEVGKRPLIHAARQCRPDTVKLLIERGADLNMVNHKGDSVLSVAARTGDAPLLELLLDLGVEMDLCGGSALFWAVHDYRIDAVRFLLEQGLI